MISTQGNNCIPALAYLLPWSFATFSPQELQPDHSVALDLVRLPKAGLRHWEATGLPLTPHCCRSLLWSGSPVRSTYKQEVAYEAMPGLKNTICVSWNVIFNVTTFFLLNSALVFGLMVRNVKKKLRNFPSRAPLKESWLLYRKCVFLACMKCPFVRLVSKINTFILTIFRHYNKNE